MEDINNVAVEVKNGEMDEEEIIAYIKYLEKKFPDETLKSLSIKLTVMRLILDYTFYPLGFERIRRITGYLVGTLDRFNDAKAAEEKESGQTCIKKQLKSSCFFNLILSHQCITDNKFLFL